MNITGLVRIDLSEYVDRAWTLYVGDAVVRAIYARLVRGAARVELHIGDARDVHWDPRLVEMLAGTVRVTVVGADSRGVAQATDALRAVFKTSAA